MFGLHVDDNKLWNISAEQLRQAFMVSYKTGRVITEIMKLVVVAIHSYLNSGKMKKKKNSKRKIEK